MAVYLDSLLGDHFILMIVRVLIALVLSGLIGFEREMKNHSAGFRTHILVGIGSCMMMLLAIFGFNDYVDTYHNISFDPSRIPSYVVSGIGFLGAGTIIVYGGTIRGLTTAASIWTVAGLGLVIGAGMYATAVFTTFVILLSLAVLNKFEKFFKQTNVSLLLKIIATNGFNVDDIKRVLETKGIKINSVEVLKEANEYQYIDISIEQVQSKWNLDIIDTVMTVKSVKSITIAKNE